MSGFFDINQRYPDAANTLPSTCLPDSENLAFLFFSSVKMEILCSRCSTRVLIRTLSP